MQQYFFIEKSGFLESIDGVNIKKNYLTCPNGSLKEMNVREIFEFLKTK
jgi:hypothetical protein